MDRLTNRPTGRPTNRSEETLANQETNDAAMAGAEKDSAQEQECATVNWIITAPELRQSLESAKPLKLVDVREPEEHEESRIDGSVLLPLGEIQLRAESELSKEDEIVLYCAHGIRSLQALMALRMQGYENLRSLEGGIVAWKKATGLDQ